MAPPKNSKRPSVDGFARKVWIPDQLHGYVLAQIVDIGGDSFTVELLGTKGSTKDNTRLVSCTATYPAVENDNAQEDDNCALIYLNEATLLHNTKLRYFANKIYTYVANILIAVNPYIDIPALYNTDVIHKYRGQSLGVLPPHLFAIADKAYREMRRNVESQSIIVSGESGAGKTESQKYILRFLCESYGDGDGLIEQRILETNPILEAFGNAKTLRNNNSSRFGKFVEIHFTDKFAVAGGYVSHYLLEKARVCRQQRGERNFHIFYQLLAGLDSKLRSEFRLSSPDKYNYLKHGVTQFFSGPRSKNGLDNDRCSEEHRSSGALHDPVVDDLADFQRINASLGHIGLSEEEKSAVYATVAGILHLGNVDFEDNVNDSKGGSVVTSDSDLHMTMASRLLGLDKDELRMGLLSRMMQPTKGGGVKGTLIRVPLKPGDACAARDALAKATYSRLFDYVVSKVNSCIPFSASSSYIGVLDIAGFEYFQQNSFEQFCINYCNEKLQQFFNDRILKQEQELYEREGLNVKHIDFVDNQDCIDMIEQKTTGILDILDEEMRLPRPSYQHFTTQVHQVHRKHFRLELPRKSKLREHRELVRDDEGFLVRHFAGAVCYQTSQFLDKNNDALHESLSVVLEDSRSPLIKQLFATPIKSPSDRNKGLGAGSRKLVSASVGAKFRAQLNELLTKLTKTGTHFVRCLKPNSKMKPADFEGSEVLSQLKCSGMPSVLELMQQGYPSRTNFASLYDTYKTCMPPRLQRLDPRLFAKCLFKALGLNDYDFKFGLTKVFFRPGKFAEFDQMLRADPEHLAVLVQKVQAWLIRTRWKQAQWCTLSTIKQIFAVRRKIEYRMAARIVMQSTVRSFLAQRRHRHRFVTTGKCRKMMSQISIMCEIANDMDGANKTKWSEKIEQFSADIEHLIKDIKNNAMLPKQEVVQRFDQLCCCSGQLLSDIKAAVAADQRERQRLKELEEQAEKQRKQQELEAQRAEQLAREHAEKKKLEAERKAEEERYEKEKKARLDKAVQESVVAQTAVHTAPAAAPRRQKTAGIASSSARGATAMPEAGAEDEATALLLAELDPYNVDPEIVAMQQKAHEQALQRRALLEQEKLDRDLAMRLAREYDENPVAESPPEVQRVPQQNAKPHSADLSTWRYADLRDLINTSTTAAGTALQDLPSQLQMSYIDLIQACRTEFHRRLQMFHNWTARNFGGTSEAEAARAPPEVLRTASVFMAPPDPSHAPRRHRFFRVPLAPRPSERYRTAETVTAGGFWFVHFDGQYAVRQMEVNPPRAVAPLIAGRDDLKMIELPLEQTGLTRKKGAEITQNDFETIWSLNGGPEYAYSGSETETVSQ